MKNALFILGRGAFPQIYGVEEKLALRKHCNLLEERSFSSQEILERPDLLEKAEVIFSGWGAPMLDESFLSLTPNLELFLYGAGTVKYFVTEAFWQREIPICSAWAMNAIPVAEYTVSQIIFGLKRGYELSTYVKENRAFPPGEMRRIPGTFRSTVGLISLGMIGRMVAERLQRYEMDVLAYDPFVTPEEAETLGVKLVSLEELFEKSDCVSLHTPWLKETENMVTGKLLASMKPRSTFINTARGAIVNEEEMIEVLNVRPDIQAILDVTQKEPPVPESLLYDLPNVVLTPHIAGSTWLECRRMGREMVREMERWLKGEPLQWSLTRERVAIMA